MVTRLLHPLSVSPVEWVGFGWLGLVGSVGFGKIVFGRFGLVGWVWYVGFGFVR